MTKYLIKVKYVVNFIIIIIWKGRRKETEVYNKHMNSKTWERNPFFSFLFPTIIFYIKFEIIMKKNNTFILI